MMNDQPNQSLEIGKEQTRQASPNLKMGTYYANALACASCDFRTFSVQALQIHKPFHVSKKSQYQCDKCNYSVPSRKRLKNHLLAHHLKKNPLISQQQNLEINNEAYVNEKNNKEAGFKRIGLQYECEKCDFNTASVFNMRYHRKCHLRNQQIKCRLCSFSSIKNYAIVRHLKLHHRDGSPASFLPFSQVDSLAGSLSQMNEKKLDENYAANHPLPDINRPDVGLQNRTLLLNDPPCELSSVTENKSAESESIEMDQSEESATRETDKWPLCDYSTDHLVNAQVHEKAYQQNQEFKFNICTYSTDLCFVFNRHMKKDHRNRQNAESDAETHNEDNTGIEPARSSELSKTIETGPKDERVIEMVDLCEDNDVDMEESSRISIPWSFEAGAKSLIDKSGESSGNVKTEESNCRKHISKLREDIRLARISIRKMRKKVQLQQHIRLEKKRELELLSNRVASMEEVVRINSEKLMELSLKKNKLESIRISINGAARKQLKSELELKTLQCEDLKSRIAALDSIQGDNIDVTSYVDEVIQLQNEGIKGCELNLEKIRNETKLLREEEIVMARDVERVETSVIGVDSDSQKLQDLRLELDGLELNYQTCLADNTEDLFNELVISTEEKNRNYFESKNRLFEIMILKTSIRRMFGWKN